MNVGFLVGGIVGLVVVAPLVLLLAARVVHLGRDSAAYADDILANGVAVTADLDPVPALVETQRLVRRATEGAVRYVEALQRLA